MKPSKNLRNLGKKARLFFFSRMQMARRMPLGPPVWNKGFWKKLRATRNSKRKLEQE